MNLSVGTRHQNRRGNFIITNITGQEATIRYEDGVEAKCEIQFLERVVRKVLNEDPYRNEEARFEEICDYLRSKGIVFNPHDKDMVIRLADDQKKIEIERKKEETKIKELCNYLRSRGVSFDPHDKIAILRLADEQKKRDVVEDKERQFLWTCDFLKTEGVAFDPSDRIAVFRLAEEVREQQRKHRVIQLHQKYLQGNGIYIDGNYLVEGVQGNPRMTICHGCWKPLNSSINKESCPVCGWIVCPECGACGCGHPSRRLKVSEKGPADF